MEELRPVFDARFREQFAMLLRWRRDVRHFRTEPVDADLLQACIDAACLAPSVGYSQPWRFVDVRSEPARAATRENFERCNADALAHYQGEQAHRYAALKLAGLREAPSQFAVFTDTDTATGHGLGRRTMPATLDYSTVMAIQNFWLAARAAGLGVGWVSSWSRPPCAPPSTFRRHGSSRPISASATRHTRRMSPNCRGWAGKRRLRRREPCWSARSRKPSGRAVPRPAHCDSSRGRSPQP